MQHAVLHLLHLLCFSLKLHDVHILHHGYVQVACVACYETCICVCAFCMLAAFQVPCKHLFSEIELPNLLE